MGDESSTFEDLATKCSAKGLREYYELVWERQKERGVQDASTRIRHTESDLRFMKDVLFAEVQARFARDSVECVGLPTVRRQVADGINGRLIQTARDGSLVRIVRDGFYNEASGIGTSLDPSMYSHAYVPISISPEEGSAIYASGGIAGVIIDKKSKGVMVNGYRFKGNGWSDGELEQMHDHVARRGFTRATSSVLRDAFVFGGAIMYPHLVNDTPISYDMTISELCKAGVATKDCIDRFVTTDRWNCVFVPRWDVTAEDYMKPRSYYIPLGGIKIATERSAIVRPKELPFWAAIRQIGWGITDIEGWIRSMYGYENMIGTLPVLFQQMSLLFQQIPLDGLLSQSGLNTVEEIIRATERKMKEWAATKPKLLGMGGEVKTVERHYENLDQIIIMGRQDLGAKSGIPESVIWPSQPTGLADSREEDVQLKESDTVKRAQMDVAPAFQPIARLTAISTFGPTDEVMRRLDTLEMSFDAPATQTPKQKAESFGKMTEGISTLVNAAMPLDCAVKMALVAFEEFNMPKEVMDRIEQVPPETAGEAGYEPLDALEAVIARAQQLAGGAGGPAIQKLQRMADEIRNPGLKLLRGSADEARRMASGN